jgi:hypothetical protein
MDRGGSLEYSIVDSSGNRVGEGGETLREMATPQKKLTYTASSI